MASRVQRKRRRRKRTPERTSPKEEAGAKKKGVAKKKRAGEEGERRQEDHPTQKGRRCRARSARAAPQDLSRASRGDRSRSVGRADLPRDATSCSRCTRRRTRITAAGAQGVWIHVDRTSTQDLLLRAKPDHYFRPPYVGVNGWVGAWIDGRPDWSEIAELLRDGYRERAGKRLAGAARRRRMMPRRAAHSSAAQFQLSPRS